jgi:hypothetical protein
MAGVMTEVLSRLEGHKWHPALAAKAKARAAATTARGLAINDEGAGWLSFIETSELFEARSSSRGGYWLNRRACGR